MNKNKKEEEKARKEEEKAKYDRYIRYESYCKELRDKNIALQDKIVITISSALFGIIITSLDKLLPLFDTFKLNCFLIPLVVANALTICFFLVSIHFAKEGLKNSIDNAKINYREKGEIGEIKVNQYTKYAELFQNIYLFLFGIVIIIFAIMLIYIFF